MLALFVWLHVWIRVSIIRMVSLSNGGLSNEVSYKRPLETGFMPKYKPRKVFAIRDFPPGCGPNAVPVNSRPEESFAGEVAGSREASSSIDVRLAMMFDKLIEKVNENVGNGEITITRGLTDEVHEAILEPDLVGVDIVKNIDTLDHSGSQLVVEELKEDHGVASFQNSSVEVDKSLGGPREFSAICGSIQPEISIMQKDKYHPRRVSAVRDFPPHCGIYVSSLIEEEKRMAAPEMEITSEMLRTLDECLDGLHNVCVEIEESETLDANSGRGLLGEMTVATAEGGVMEFEEYNRDLEHDITKTNGACAGSYTMSKALVNIRIEDAGASVGKEIVTFSPDRNDKDMPLHSDFSSRNDLNRELVDGLVAAPLGWRKSKASISSPNGSKDDVDREVVQGVRAAPNYPWKKETAITNSHGGTSGAKKRKHIVFWRQNGKAVAKKSKPEMKSLGLSSKKKKKVHKFNDVINGPGSLTLEDDGAHDGDSATTFPSRRNLKEYEISFPRFGPRFGPKSSSHGDDRNRVRETLRLFNATCRKLLQLEEEEDEEANPTEGQEGRSKQKGRKGKNRIDLEAAKVLKRNKKYVNTTKRIGAVPGVEVGDEFQYRVELAVVGIHFPFQSGIDSMKVNELLLATSIVTSGAYNDDVENADVLRYSGQGGNVVGNSKSKQPEDQKLKGGNLALKNCIDTKTPVRVVRGWREMKYVDPLDSKPKLVTTYVYDGLYTVTDCFTEKGSHGKKVFMFDLRRNPGQPDLAWKELKKSSKCKTRLGVCVADISYGKERIPICAVNTIDNGKPPPFNYISKMMYPDWYRPIPPEGCNCVGRCSAMEKCSCADRNGGAIPYNHNGALVETKTLVYECGPHCKCPPSCYNRATQRGIKFQLEIFKTEWRGWGVRALTSIPSGSFICEYAGELLEDKEAEERIGYDEYLFDIVQNLQDSSPTNSDDDETVAELKGVCFTIDALTYGNVGRFINHSCAPNLLAQNVIYDNKDKRLPHVMLFAMENIPPLQELTYCYNYSLGQIRDSEGNVKVKNCYCGAAGCTGRLY
ncbi:uncharacterized protein LOC121751931 isoform X1 [Salvia splendens]|nr:uncharacterized protein LOC121751931 isoform X1 [Salvia splendens]